MSHPARNPVREALMSARLASASAFERWCILQHVQHLPAAPGAVAAFIRDQSALPIEKLWKAVEQISFSHLENGLADPTAGGPAAQAMSEIANIDPPRCWKKADHDAFRQMPYNLQRRVADRENRRDLEVRRLQTELATTRQQLTSLKNIVQGKADYVAIEENAAASA
jgi:hypothetical protein